jgi:hypothetical protein
MNAGRRPPACALMLPLQLGKLRPSLCEVLRPVSALIQVDSPREAVESERERP